MADVPIKVIILDFDGVIVESNAIKHQAFSRIFSQFPEHYDQIMTYHYAHNAVNRHDKFRYIIENILMRPFDAMLAKQWALEISHLTREAIINCSEVTGASEFLMHFTAKYPVYLASATPMDELAVILEKRGYSRYFKGVYGAPAKKRKIFEEIANCEMVEPKNVLYVGDSREDYEVANDFGCMFIGRIGNFDFNGFPVQCFDDLSSIKTYIQSHLE